MSILDSNAVILAISCVFGACYTLAVHLLCRIFIRI